MRYWFAILLILTGFNMHGAFGKESDTILNRHDQVSIISASDFYEGQETVLFGLRMKLEPGWHTYWLNPGDAGDPASIQVSVNDNKQSLMPKIEWPVPERLSEKGLMSYVYHGEVILPFYLTIPKAYRQQDLSLHVKAVWLICANVCIPEQGDFTITLPKGKGNESKENRLIQQALMKSPVELKKDIYITPSGKIWINRLDLGLDMLQDAWFMPEKNGRIDQDQTQEFQFHSNYFELDLPLLSKKPLEKSVAGILAIKDQKKNSHYWFIHPVVKDQPSSYNLNIFLLLGSAFLGGFLLNFMPCVFPVIAMKLLSLSRIGKKDRFDRYKAGLSYSAGILCCFAGISLVFTSLRWMGSQIFWGVQFQSVSFLVILCWLLFIIALNFLDVFTINISMGSFQGKSFNSCISDFLTGILAVLIATPCTAPFMGVAVAAALNRSAGESFLIFMAMGAGLAFPYLLLAFIPYLTRFLPKPGVWMEVLKQCLAFPLFLSCVWLIWVIHQHQDSIALLLVLLGGVFIAFFAWLLGRAEKIQYKTHNDAYLKAVRILIALVFILFSGGFVVASYFQSNDHTMEKQAAKVFSIKDIQQLRAKHQAIFVNMTASWCLTCLVNDKVALSSSKVQNYFQQNHIQYRIGDWTDHNDEISRFLKQFGREGVPLYIYYPVKGDPKILPQLLTPDLVISKIESYKN